MLINNSNDSSNNFVDFLKEKINEYVSKELAGTDGEIDVVKHVNLGGSEFLKIEMEAKKLTALKFLGSFMIEEDLKKLDEIYSEKNMFWKIKDTTTFELQLTNEEMFELLKKKLPQKSVNSILESKILEGKVPVEQKQILLKSVFELIFSEIKESINYIYENLIGTVLFNSIHLKTIFPADLNLLGNFINYKKGDVIFSHQATILNSEQKELLFGNDKNMVNIWLEFYHVFREKKYHHTTVFKSFSWNDHYMDNAGRILQFDHCYIVDKEYHNIGRFLKYIANEYDKDNTLKLAFEDVLITVSKGKVIRIEPYNKEIVPFSIS